MLFLCRLLMKFEFFYDKTEAASIDETSGERLLSISLNILNKLFS